MFDFLMSRDHFANEKLGFLSFLAVSGSEQYFKCHMLPQRF